MTKTPKKTADTTAVTLLGEIRGSGGLTLGEAGKLFADPLRPDGYTADALRRWVTAGVTGADGERVKLEAVRLGGRWLTTRGAVGRFLTATSGAELAV